MISAGECKDFDQDIFAMYQKDCFIKSIQQQLAIQGDTECLFGGAKTITGN